MSAETILHEVFTWPWLDALSRRYGRAVTLADVPPDAWDAIALPGVEWVWLMGVWERSDAGRAVALTEPSFRAATASALPDARDEDVVGSAYCIRSYRVDERLGGDAGLAEARRQLRARGLRLMLDWVPNHVAPDHAWVDEHPEYFVRGSDDDLARDPGSWLGTAHGPVARGRDPYFPAWPDVVQLNPWHPGLRAAAAAELTAIADRCDGVRCDMAMLFLDDVAERTWGGRLGARPGRSYWQELLPAVRSVRPGFVFAAEAYWDLESRLVDEGFDLCYDKRLTDRLVHGDPNEIRDHLRADPEWQRRLVRFLENHDEPRAAAVLPLERLRLAALALLTLPGTALLYEGQTDGRRVRLPVHLGRGPVEPRDGEIAAAWLHLLGLAESERIRTGAWRLLEPAGSDSLLAWRWERHLVVLNWADTPAAGRVRLDVPPGRVVLVDLLDGSRYERNGTEIAHEGLFVALGGRGAHLFRLG